MAKRPLGFKAAATSRANAVLSGAPWKVFAIVGCCARQAAQFHSVSEQPFTICHSLASQLRLIQHLRVKVETYDMSRPNLPGHGGSEITISATQVDYCHSGLDTQCFDYTVGVRP